VREGEFPFAAVGLAHSHIYGMCEGLLSAGASLSWVYEEDEALLSAFLKRYPHVRAARCLDEILEDKTVKMVASAAIPSHRCPIGLRVMASGKYFFADKAPFVTMDALASARQAVKETGSKYAVFFHLLRLVTGVNVLFCIPQIPFLKRRYQRTVFAISAEHPFPSCGEKIQEADGRLLPHPQAFRN
jgi:hypothetical protein